MARTGKDACYWALRSNSQSLTPSMNAVHSLRVNVITGAVGRFAVAHFDIGFHITNLNTVETVGTASALGPGVAVHESPVPEKVKDP